MSRTYMEIPMKDNSVDYVLSTVAGVLNPEGFKEKIVDNEQVWAKGDAVIMLMQCFQVSFTENSVIIQVWLKDAIVGESDLEGYRAITVKKKLKNLLSVISAKIASQTRIPGAIESEDKKEDLSLEMRPRFCSHCGNLIITEEARFCRKCGFRL